VIKVRNSRRGAWSAIAAIALAVAAVATVVPGTPPAPASAADLSKFDPGFIISDRIFYDWSTMSATSIQAFLDGKGKGCTPAAGGTPCLKDFHQTTTTRAATERCTGAYQGASNESAATILAKVAKACGVSPQVLIVTLQKEQGLVTASGTGLYPNRYRSAMGFGCPDTAACDSTYYGFFNQVYSAASQFRRYALHPDSYGHQAGMYNTILYNPNTACGSSTVFIVNQATAGLYNYTPYRPNAAALAAGYGTGNSCSSYGNRNFWNYFTDWFGPTTNRLPIGHVDQVAFIPGGVRVVGWALDPDTAASIAVHIYVDGKGFARFAKNPRSDLSRFFPALGINHGFDEFLALGPGGHSVCTYAIDSDGGTNQLIKCVSLTIPNYRPEGHLDSLTTSALGISLSGWAFDRNTLNPIQVHVYVDGGGHAITADRSRTDVGRAYPGVGNNHGFAFSESLPLGNHRVCAYAIDANGGPALGLTCQTVTVRDALPEAHLDSVSTSIDGISLRGWAFDRDAAGPIQVHVYVDGTVYSIAADRSRPDVGRAYPGVGDNHGFAFSKPVPAGDHRVCVYAIDSTGGPALGLGCRTVTAPNARPLGHVDSMSSTVDGIAVGGWALDLDTSKPISVHVYVDGVSFPITAAGARADVGRAYPGLGDNHGFTFSRPVAVGTHHVCVYAIDSAGGPAALLQCADVVH